MVSLLPLPAALGKEVKMIWRRDIHAVCRLGKTNDINMYILYLLVTFFQFSSEIK